MAFAAIVPFLIAGLLVGGVGGVLVYRQIEYGTPPSWQTEIISRFSVTDSSGVTLTSHQFEYQGNAEWTDLYGTGGISDCGMWSVLIDANSSATDLKHMRLMTLFIAGQRSGVSPYYWVLGSITLGNTGITLSYGGTPVTTVSSTWMQLEISTTDFSLMTHISK